MAYFNKKEQVLDIKLTQYGKYALSIGKLNPTYYKFFDDNILYDGAHANITEAQNDVHGRIVNQTPQSLTQHNYVGVETEFKKDYNSQSDQHGVSEFQKINIKSNAERDCTLLRELGTTDMGSAKIPEWKVQLLHGKIDTFSETLETPYQKLDIPQINCDLYCDVRTLNIESRSLFDTEQELVSPVAFDGTFFGVVPGHILGLFLETETEFEKENFDIEVYEISDSFTHAGSPIEDLRQLTFARYRQPAVVDGILLDKSEIKYDFPTLTRDHVEYYFDILLDNAIPESTICESVRYMRPQDIFADIEIKCPEFVVENKIVDPYASNITLATTMRRVLDER